MKDAHTLKMSEILSDLESDAVYLHGLLQGLDMLVHEAAGLKAGHREKNAACATAIVAAARADDLLGGIGDAAIAARKIQEMIS